MSGGHVWRTALEQLRKEISRAQFDTWLRGTQLSMSDDGAAVLHVQTTFARELLETRFRERIEQAIAQVTGHACRLRVVVGTAAAADEPTADEAAAPSAPALALARAASAPYGGPTLFSAAANEPGADLPPASARNWRAGPLVAGRRRAAPSTDRVRAAVGRSSPPFPTRSSGGATSASPTAASVPLQRQPDAPAQPVASARDARPPTAHVSGTPPERRATTRQPERYSPRDSRLAHNAGTSDESDGDEVMNENADPHGTSSGGVPIPRLNPRYTFATFIVGSGNQLAHAASQAIADAPGQAYNPLFLYGGVGLGKTHLLHAIGHKALEVGLTVLYVSSETFTNEIINAIRYRTTDEFRAKYRSVDVLLVDDIQFIAGKDSTEEEFFHTFNSLYEMSKQIVMCSDRPPKAIVSLEERLRSRFEWGLIADIQPPDLLTRVAILRAKSDLMRRVVPDDVVNYLAGRVQSNIRELEGSFNRLLAFAQLQGLPLTIDTAKAAFASIASDGRQRRVSVAEILAAVAEYYRIPADDLRGKQRDKHIVVPRQVAMYLMRQETEASLLEIGQSLGGRDHSTVLHGCEKIGRQINEDTGLRKEVLAIRQQLLG
ncbi:MAG TPA: chromosomal replication initiator protein DnaA [Ktedonobacterales bacterium]|nr:chromosomal replication initiator protein DnaA [Ktedonobacterales bacterium]